MRDIRIYIKGTSITPTKRNWGGKPTTYKHFHPDDNLYYKKEGKFYCIVDDKSARGYVVRTEDGKESFLPHDYQDLISHAQAKALCRAEGVYLPSPNHPRHGHRTPPPLFTIAHPQQQRPAWNRSAILRHIDECKKRRNLVP